MLRAAAQKKRQTAWKQDPNEWFHGSSKKTRTTLEKVRRRRKPIFSKSARPERRAPTSHLRRRTPDGTCPVPIRFLGH
jgi:hypothetical protein